MRIAGDDEQCVVPMLVGIVVDEWVSQVSMGVFMSGCEWWSLYLFW